MGRKKASIVEEWVTYLSARLAGMAITCLPVEQDLKIAASLGRWLYSIDARHRKRTAYHLGLAFEHWTQAQRDQVARQSFEHLLKLVVEAIYTPRLIHSDSWPYRIRTRGLAPAIDLLNRNEPLLLVTGHVGNWEVLGTMLASLGYKMTALARPLNQKKLNDWILGIREANGMRILTKWDATDAMQQILQSGGALGFIADQNAGDRGMFVPFFGRLASSYKSIGLLAMSFNCPIVCGYAHRLDPQFRFELGATDIIYPEDWAGQPDPLYYITARFNRAIEAMVRLRPDQYLWMHRRWKSRPRFERQDKPMPARLRHNIEQLPWMDAATLEAIAHPKPVDPAVYR